MSDLLPVTGIILCGGQSKRMGRPKAFLPFAGKSLIEHGLDLMMSVFAEVILVTNNPDDYEHLSASIVRDIIPNRGPLVGILSGLLVSNHEHVFVMPCDMPAITKNLMREICRLRHKKDMIIYGHKRKLEPLLGVYSRNCIEALEEAIFQGKDFALDFVESRNPEVYEQSIHNQAPLLPHFNVDTPADYGILCGAI